MTQEKEVSKACQRQRGRTGGHKHRVLYAGGQGHQTLMVRAAIAAEEECKSIPYAYGDHSSKNSGCNSPPNFSRRYATTLAQDGLLLVHPLVLDEVPATLRASTLILKGPRRRCPPAASPRSGTGGWSGWGGGASNGPLSYPSQPPRLQRPSHLRPLAAALFKMLIRATLAASLLPLKHEALAEAKGVETPLRREATLAPEGHLLRGRPGEQIVPKCLIASRKLWGGHTARHLIKDTLAQDTLAHSKWEGHAAQTHLSQHPVGFRTPVSGRRAQGHSAPT